MSEDREKQEREIKETQKAIGKKRVGGEKSVMKQEKAGASGGKRAKKVKWSWL